MITLASILAGVLAAALAVFWMVQRRGGTRPLRLRKKHTRQMTVPYYF